MDRAERRRQLKEDRRLVIRGLPGAQTDLEMIVSLMRVLHDLVEEARDAGTVTPLMTFFQENMVTAGRPGPTKALACRRGCSHCCYAWVSARAPEILFAKKAVPARDREAVRASVAAVYAVTGQLDFDGREGISTPCPLLADDQCRIYAARPAVCRTAVSADARICERAYRQGDEAAQIPTPEFYINLRSGYSIALAGALKRAGYAPWAYEYNAGLHAALARADAEAAWLAGEDVFADVPVGPTGDAFTLSGPRNIYDAAFG
jgi:Fe-S-cluster containining protein